MNTYVIKLSPKDLEKIQKKIKLISCKEEDIHLFKGKILDVNFVIFKTMKMVLQGKDVTIAKDILENILSKKEVENKSFKSLPKKKVYDHRIGSDEVGVGDFFGPVVVCAVYLSKENIEKVKELGVKDSKLLDKAEIIDLAKKIIKIADYEVSMSNPKSYNALIENNLNAHVVKAYNHNKAITKLLTRVKEKTKTQVIIDKFVDSKKYFEYLKKISLSYPELKNMPITKEHVFFEEKAESKYIAVAAASILARYFFLIEIDKMNKEYGVIFPLGASKIVDEFATKLKGNKKIDFKKIAKIHFANFKRI